jgi:hypothetical protein
MFSKRAVQYFESLTPPELPGSLEVMNPYGNRDSMKLVKKFYNKFYKDEKKRLFIFGINPGRFGGGLTGVSFTDPVALREYCGIENDLGDRRELSSEFIYKMIEYCGGVKVFFSRCYMSALFPLALIKDNKNYNFYDDKKIFNKLLPYIRQSIISQIEFGGRRDKVISLGLKNAGILILINDELKIFDKIEFLEHPRYIMQYKRKKVDEYLNKYVSVLGF